MNNIIIDHDIGNVHEIMFHLQVMCEQSSSRCLYQSSKWASENLIGMSISTTNNSLMNDMIDLNSFIDISLHDITSYELNVIFFAQSLITNLEFQRCSHFLLPLIEMNKIHSSKAYFLAFYSFYMAGEKIKDQQVQESIIIDSPSSLLSSNESSNSNSNSNSNNNIKNHGIDNTTNITKEMARNPFLPEVYQAITKIYTLQIEKMDAFMMYLYGVVTRDMSKQYGLPYIQSESPMKVARKYLMLSIASNPLNWSCWLELIQLCLLEDQPLVLIPNINEIYELKDLTKSQKQITQLMYYFFYSHISIELQDGNQALEILNILLPIFPNSSYVIGQIALAHYNIRNYDNAQDTFEVIRERDPYRMENIDTYSNILYVKEEKAALSYLAHVLMKINRYSPECCCVIGNFYSLKGLHEKAIIYFSRALKLNAKFLSAWTLIGHECVEIRNATAAVQCYQRAIRLNRLDYRSWYGLGQIYEMLHMYSYALYYYKKATFVRSNDARMWCAVGNCYQHLNYISYAILAYESAIQYDDREGIATKELGKLYRSSDNLENAIKCYLQYWIHIGFIDNDTYHVTPVYTSLRNNDIDSSLADMIIFLSNYFVAKGYTDHANEYCSILLEYIGPEGEEARSILRQIRSSNNNNHHNVNNNTSISLNEETIHDSHDSMLSFFSLDRSHSSGTIENYDHENENSDSHMSLSSPLFPRHDEISSNVSNVSNIMDTSIHSPHRL